jgi:hypothetical protein
MMLVSPSETVFCLGISALGEWQRNWQKTDAARADYAAMNEASSSTDEILWTTVMAGSLRSLTLTAKRNDHSSTPTKGIIRAVEAAKGRTAPYR